MLPECHSQDGISELKWGKNRFIPYLCINPVKDENPLERDAEEYMEIVHDMTIKDLKNSITRAEMMLPSVQTTWMALEYLREHEFII